MASTYKTFLNNDIVSTQTLLHEAIPLTGTIVSGTYNDENIKTYAHGMFEGVFDYPYLSSSANHIFDLTVGYSSDSSLSSSTHEQNAKKINIYTEMAQILVGFDQTGSIREFDQDGDLSVGTKIKEALFINFSRLLMKDEIKKQSFSLTVYTGSVVGGSAVHPTGSLLIQDLDGLNAYKVNSPAGEYGLLYSGSADSTGPSAATSDIPAGLIYYQAGIIVLTASIFKGNDDGLLPSSIDDYFGLRPGAAKRTIDESLTGSSITGSCDGLRNRLKNISFNNTTELNSTIYFCRANNNEFNYSANQTYLSGALGRSEIRVKNFKSDMPLSYVTTVGLYSANTELLAVAKLSEPMKKDPNMELTLRVRIDT